MERDIARLLNASTTDRNKIEELVNDYFGSVSVDELSSSEDDWEEDAYPSVIAVGNVNNNNEHVTVNKVAASAPGPGPACPGAESDDASLDDSEDESTSLGDGGYESAMGAANSANFITGDTEIELQKAMLFKCSCKFYGGEPCFTQFCAQEMVSRRLDMQAMTPRDQMLVLLGKLSCTINNAPLISPTKKQQKERQHQRTIYLIDNKRVCRGTFKFLHGMSQNRLTALLAWYKVEGLAPKEKRSGGRKSNTRVFSFDDIQAVVRFLVNYAADHALVLPGRVPGFKRDDVKLLPSSHTKAKVYASYKASTEAAGNRTMGPSSFGSFWKQLTPFIVVCKPMSDLCWICQSNNTLIFRGANIPDEEKSERLKQQEEHLRLVHLERSLYNNMVEESRKACRKLVKLQPSAPCSRAIVMHYSFDYAQQVHLPSNPLQPGPIYFLVPCKCGLFGVCCEGIPRQVNFIIDEAHSISKGSNAVVSYLHYFFEHYGLGETDVHLHCDNCSGQNKNRFVLWYCMWRVAIGLHKSITLNFLVAGHTKFAPDWCFGLLKRAFRRNAVSSLSEMADVVTGSAEVNVAQLVGREDGTSLVPVYDWHTHLAPFFKPLHGIKRIQHFRFDANHPGVVFTKVTAESEENTHNLLASHQVAADLPKDPPVPIQPPGLDLQRQQYLYKHIRQFVAYEWKDVMCPEPAVPTIPPRQARGRGRGRGGRGRAGRGRGQNRDSSTNSSSSSSSNFDSSDASSTSPRRESGHGRGRGRGRGRGEGVAQRARGRSRGARARRRS